MYQLVPNDLVNQALNQFKDKKSLTLQIEGEIPEGQNHSSPKLVIVNLSITDGINSTQPHFAGEQWNTSASDGDDTEQINQGIQTIKAALNASGITLNSTKSGYPVSIKF